MQERLYFETTIFVCSQLGSGAIREEHLVNETFSNFVHGDTSTGTGRASLVEWSVKEVRICFLDSS